MLLLGGLAAIGARITKDETLKLRQTEAERDGARIARIVAGCGAVGADVPNVVRQDEARRAQPHVAGGAVLFVTFTPGIGGIKTRIYITYSPRIQLFSIFCSIMSTILPNIAIF